MQADVVIGLFVGVVSIFLQVSVTRWLWNSTRPDVPGVEFVATGQAIRTVLTDPMPFRGRRDATARGPVALPDAAKLLALRNRIP